MTTTLDIITARLTAIHRRFGTITDISLLARLSVDELYDAPMLLPDDVTRLKWGLDNGAWEKWEGIVFVRDGRKVLAFARQYADAYNNALSEVIRRGNAESFEIYVRYALKWIVTVGLDTARAKMRELHESELTAEDWAALTEMGGGWITRMEIDPETEIQQGRVIARAFIEARDNMEKHLEKLWLELFAERGIDGAKAWMKEFWTPASPEAKEAINAAYVAAKRKFTVETK
jgi:hypothetical protein